MKAQHSKATVRWGTPLGIVERARDALGNVIDVDPASESKFNETVGATTYYSLTERGEDGLLLPWFGRVLINPPGGLIPEFWRRAMLHPGPLVWIGFSVEQLCLLADELNHPMDFSTVILRKRLGFDRHDGFRGSPSHGNYITGINIDPNLFENCFKDLGRISHGPLSQQ